MNKALHCDRVSPTLACAVEMLAHLVCEMESGAVLADGGSNAVPLDSVMSELSAMIRTEVVRQSSQCYTGLCDHWANG